MATECTDEELEAEIRYLALASIDAIEWCGWTKGVIQNEEGEVCLAGAQHLAASDGQSALSSHVECGSVRHKANLVLADRICNLVHNVRAGFNDNSNTAKEDVITVLAKVAGVDPMVVLYA